MTTRLVTSRLLAVLGTLLVWIPVGAPLLLALASLATGNGFRYDYLMPAEIFPLALVGAALLIAAAFLAHQPWRPIVIPIVIAAACFGLMVVVAEITGLADGSVALGGWQYSLVMTILVVFTCAEALTAISGTRLTGRVWRLSLPG